MLRIISLAVVLFSVTFAQIGQASLLVWSDYIGSVRTANTDGTNVAVIATNAAGGVAVDNLTGRVYWGSTSGTIRSANIDGSDQQLVASTGSGVVWNMFVDGGHLYFNSSGNLGVTGVGRVNLDGSGLVRIGDNISGEGLAFDRDNQKVFYQHFGGGGEPSWTMKTVDASGVGSPAALPYQPNLTFVPGLFVDDVQDKLYYAATSTSGIYRSHLDGSSLTLVADLPGYGEYSVFVDSPNNTIYYGIRGSGQIGRLDLDGTNQQTLLTSAPDFYALTVYELIPPIPEPATVIIWSLLGGAGAAIVYWRRKRTP